MHRRLHGIARAPRGSFTDNLFHQVDISRRGDLIRIFFDESEYLTVSDSTFTTGAAGVGSYNNAVSFDDIAIQERIGAVGVSQIARLTGPPSGIPLPRTTPRTVAALMRTGRRRYSRGACASSRFSENRAETAASSSCSWAKRAR